MKPPAINTSYRKHARNRIRMFEQSYNELVEDLLNGELPLTSDNIRRKNYLECQLHIMHANF